MGRWEPGPTARRKARSTPGPAACRIIGDQLEARALSREAPGERGKT